MEPGGREGAADTEKAGPQIAGTRPISQGQFEAIKSIPAQGRMGPVGGARGLGQLGSNDEGSCGWVLERGVGWEAFGGWGRGLGKDRCMGTGVRDFLEDLTLTKRQPCAPHPDDHVTSGQTSPYCMVTCELHLP